MILKLSDLMRHVLYESRENYIPLKNEVEFVQNFIELQRIRLSSELDIEFKLEGNINNKRIIPLIFEPFIDNAFKHGCYTNIDQAYIQILLKIEDEKLIFNIENSYDPSLISDNKQSNAHGIGLKNAQKRLEYLYKKG